MHPQNSFAQPDDSQPLNTTVEQQALYNQLKMNDEDLEAWMFGEEELEDFQQPSLSAFPKTVILGQESRLSECELWPLIEQYYANMGVSAWDSQVPCFVTSSAYIAEAYAEMTLAFLEDHYEQLDLSEPLYIVEMATGVGRFSFLFLKELETKLACFTKFNDLQIRYIMTDFTENNVAYWEQHPALQPFLLKGMLDFAVFRPEQDTHIPLKVSGASLHPGEIRNPLIAIANYFFDTIRQDVFRVTEHQLEEGLITLEHTIHSEEQASAFPSFSDIEPQCRYQPVSADGYYPEPELNQILADYQQEVRFGSIIFPVGALRVIQNLQKLSGQNLMLLSSDKAFAEMNHMLLYRQHRYQVHGSFSYMVNYDAIGRLFRQQQGQYYRHGQWSTSLATVCCVATKEEPRDRERLEYFVSQHLNGSNQITSVMNAGPEETCKFTKALATIRLNLGDSRAFCIEAPLLRDEVHKATLEQRHDLLELMELAGSKAFFFRGERNLGYWLAELYDRLNLPEKSLEWTEYCMDGYTEYIWEYCYMKGRALERLGQRTLAVEFYRESCNLNPEFENAYLALKRLETLLSSGATQQTGSMTA